MSQGIGTRVQRIGLASNWARSGQVSASNEVKKAIKIATERRMKHEHDVPTLSDEAARRRTALREEIEQARGALGRAEEGRESGRKKATIEHEASKKNGCADRGDRMDLPRGVADK